MHYILEDKVTKPDFEFLIKGNNSMAYYLTNDFAQALKYLKICAIKDNTNIAHIYSPILMRTAGEYRAEKIITHFDDDVLIVKEVPSLHFKFFCDAGEWLNPVKA